MHRARVVAALGGLAIVATACAAEVRPLRAGVDACDYCRMVVADVRIGGEVRVNGGRLRTFDAIECLRDFLTVTPPEGVADVWVADYASGRLLPADRVRILRGSTLGSPMRGAGGLVAFGPGVPDSVLVSRYGGHVMTWAAARALPDSGHRGTDTTAGAKP